MITEREDTRVPAVTESASILNVIERMALDPNIDPDRIERFITLKERIDARAAKAAFDAAIAEAKSAIQPVVKNREGHNGKRYADFAAIAREVDPILSRLGLSYRFRTSQNGTINVTCVLSHRDGHSEENTLSGPADVSGSKNPIQAIGSTLMYLQRYTLVQALGIPTSEDDDGHAAGVGASSINDQQRAELDALVTETGADVDKFLAFFRVQFLAELPATKYAQARQMLEQKRRAK